MKTLTITILLTVLAALPAAQAQLSPAADPGYNDSSAGKPAIVPGYRGVSLPIPAVQTLFLSPGDRVDLLVTFEAITKGDAKEMVTATILQNIIVLNVYRPDSLDGTGVVQLLCNPNEAQYASLSLAQSKRMNVTRRAPGDTELSPMEIATFKKLFR